jgi:hypothetical protein
VFQFVLFSMPRASRREVVKVPSKLFTRRNRLLLQNLLGALNQIERRDGKVNLAYKENDQRSQHMLFNTGQGPLTAAINKIRLAAANALAKVV